MLDMKNTISFNSQALQIIFTKLNINEVKLTFVIAYYLLTEKKKVFVNTPSNREWLAKNGFKRTPDRIQRLLDTLVSKWVLIEEGGNAYSLNEHILVSNNK